MRYCPPRGFASARAERGPRVSAPAGARRLVPAVIAVTVLAAAAARANGRFPQASLIAFQPENPAHLTVTTTFGVLTSRDAGRTFGWTCEYVIGLENQEDPSVAILHDGATVLGTFGGIVTSRDGCDYGKVPALVGQIILDVALSRAVSGQVFALRSLGLGDAQYDSMLLRSDDHGQSWIGVGSPLPLGFRPLTVDVAPSDPNRLYVSGRLDRSGSYASELLRSDDGGLSYRALPIPETADQRLAYIAGVHPTDADQVFVRVDDPAGTVVWRSADGGGTFERSFSGTGRLLGFALSPDGNELALGGPVDGIWVGDATGALEQRSLLGVTCLGWSSEGLYACADAATAGFSIGMSRDAGATFEHLLSFAELCGPVGCGPGTAVSAECPRDWEVVALQIAAVCAPPAAGGSASSSGSAGTRDSGSGGTSPAAGGHAAAAKSAGSDGCAVSARRTPAAGGLATFLFALLLGSRRRRRRAVLRS